MWPTPRPSPTRLQPPIPVHSVPSASYRLMTAKSAGRSRPTSSATAVKTAAGGSPASDQRRDPPQRRLLVRHRLQFLARLELAMAVATSSVNPAI